MDPQSVNWHTHTFRCKHAKGDAPDYCRAALAAGLTTLGFSDHMPTPDRRWQSCRMEPEELAGYVAAVRAAARTFAVPSAATSVVSGQREGPHPAPFSVFAGLECEWVPDFGRAYYENELLGKAGLDYLVAGIHFAPLPGTDDWFTPFTYPRKNDAAFLGSYVKLLVAAMESRLFLFFAHPDLFGCFFDRWTPDAAAATRDIVVAAKETGSVFEINTNGLRKPQIPLADGTFHAPYPRDEFWRAVAEAGIPALVNSDAHRPEDIVGKLDEGRSFAARLGVNLIAPHELKDFEKATRIYPRLRSRSAGFQTRNSGRTSGPRELCCTRPGRSILGANR